MSRTIKVRNFSGSASPVPEAYEAPHAALSRQAAADGFVLLKNENHILPLSAGMSVALYGAGAVVTVKGGTGSGDVNERYQVSIAEGMRNAGFSIANEEWLEAYAKEYEQARQAWKQKILDQVYPEGEAPKRFFHVYSGEPFRIPSGPGAVKTDADVAIYVISRISGEGKDCLAEKGDYYLSESEHQMLSDLCGFYPRVIVLVNAGSVIDLSFLDEFKEIQALMIVSWPGMEGGNAIADVLSGAISPGGKLTDTWAFQYQDYPNSAIFSHNNGNLEEEYYEEGIYVGYRYFDSFDVPARYCFGEGLSYTSFEIENTRIRTDSAGDVRIYATVKNTGSCIGREVIQVYVSLPSGRLEKEYRRLCAFAKTKSLAPGESEEMELCFCPRDLASFDTAQAAWILEAGDYGIFVGNSIRSAIPAAILRLSEEKMLEQDEHICPRQKGSAELTCPVHHDTETLLKGLPVCEWDLTGIEKRMTDYSSPAAKEGEADRLADQLTIEKLAALTVGAAAGKRSSSPEAVGSAGISVPGSAGETSHCAVEDGIASIALADGPAGLRLPQTYYVQNNKVLPLPPEASLEHGFFYNPPEYPEAEKRYQFCTAIPVGTLLAQTWDLSLIRQVGHMIGEEMHHFGITLWLAPGMNIHRNPLCGRNFEYYSEDPLLCGKVAAALSQGVQSIPGCGVTIKHFACNNQEDNRLHSDSIVSEQALREIYLRGFGIAIREGNPLSIMTSYNRINGIHAANNYDLCSKVARREFGFRGCIMTDWSTTMHSPECTAPGCIRAGNDLIMPGYSADYEDILTAINDGSLSEAELRSCAANIIRVILQSDRYI